MAHVVIKRADVLLDRQGRTFSDVIHDREIPFDEVLAFFSDPERQRRLEEAEIHHDRPPLAGVVRELEALPAVHRFFAGIHAQRSLRFRQAIGVVVRMIMELRGWQKTGRKGSLGVRATANSSTPQHNTGGLALWFIRAERYELKAGMPFISVRRRRTALDTSPAQKKAKTASGHRGGRRTKHKQ
jgi:hypothetical protein